MINDNRINARYNHKTGMFWAGGSWHKKKGDKGISEAEHEALRTGNYEKFLKDNSKEQRRLKKEIAATKEKIKNINEKDKATSKAIDKAVTDKKAEIAKKLEAKIAKIKAKGKSKPKAETIFNALEKATPYSTIRNHTDQNKYIADIKKALPKLGIEKWKVENAVKEAKKRTTGRYFMPVTSDDIIGALIRSGDVSIK